MMLRLESASNTSELETLTDRVIELAKERGLAPEAESRLRLVLEELLTNIRMYAYPALPGYIAVEILQPENAAVADKASDALHLRIQDHGPAYDPLANHQEPDIDAGIEERPIGGLGIFLVRKLTNSLAYERVKTADDEYNQLSIEFPLRETPGQSTL